MYNAADADMLAAKIEKYYNIIMKWIVKYHTWYSPGKREDGPDGCDTYL